MIPTLAGRLQTRIFVLSTVGALLTALVVPVLPLIVTLASLALSRQQQA